MMEEKEINIDELLKKAEESADIDLNDLEAENAEIQSERNSELNENVQNSDNSANLTDEKANDDEESVNTDPLAELRAQVDQLKNDMLYKQAEFDNYRKRTIKEKAELILQGGEKVLKEILPVLDDFERALADKSDDPQAIREGMNLIYNKFNSTLERLGVKKIETADVDFNVDFHEAIALVPGMGEDKKGKVIDCVQTGYTLNDKVLRHAKVAVGQ